MWVLDTNVVSETRVTNPNANVMNFIAKQQTYFYTTEVNIAEIRFGVQKLGEADHAQILAQWLEIIVRPWFSNRILRVSEDILLCWLEIGKNVQRNKGPTPPADLLIAAIVREANMKIATRDVAPFIVAGVPTYNPWTGERFNGA